MAVTPNMGLVKWSELTDPYDHTQLAGNFQKLDEHNHTAGKGVKIPGAGIVDEAIDTPQLADESVTNAKLAGGITFDKLVPGIVAALGDLKYWWRPNVSTDIPEMGWVVAAGQTLGASEHHFPGGGSIVLPNLLNKFIQGTEVSGIGTGGGSSTINLSHSHNVNPHQHPVPGHTHTVAPHTHFINLESGLNYATNLKISQDLGGASWVHADNIPGAEHRHSISGNAHATGITTDATSLTTSTATATTDARLSSTQSIIPPWIGLLPLIKVKNS